MIFAVTQGDPAGVGPELMLATLRAAEKGQFTSRLAVYGSADWLERLASQLGQIGFGRNRTFGDLEAFRRSGEPIGLIDHANVDLSQVAIGQVSAGAGRAAFEYIDRAITAALSQTVQGVVTGPINKAALHAAGHPWPGHTEIFAARCGDPPACMMQFSPHITCTFVTTHCGYAEVPRLLTEDRIATVLRLTVIAMQQIHRRPVKIIVCGLNPHAGEGGLFGQGEEERVIGPAISQIRREITDGSTIAGPLPADTVFIPSRLRECDAVVCMYHDQGHIPVKALAFDSAVNTTLGLPIIRTSVDHGTAFDIAGRGLANPGSLFAALALAERLAAKKVSAKKVSGTFISAPGAGT